MPCTARIATHRAAASGAKVASAAHLDPRFLQRVHVAEPRAAALHRGAATAVQRAERTLQLEVGRQRPTAHL
eukprot:7387772-Prymnesium_polylepis.1